METIVIETKNYPFAVTVSGKEKEQPEGFLGKFTKDMMGSNVKGIEGEIYNFWDVDIASLELMQKISDGGYNYFLEKNIFQPSKLYIMDVKKEFWKKTKFKILKDLAYNDQELIEKFYRLEENLFEEGGDYVSQDLFLFHKEFLEKKYFNFYLFYHMDYFTRVRQWEKEGNLRYLGLSFLCVPLFDEEGNVNKVVGLLDKKPKEGGAFYDITKYSSSAFDDEYFNEVEVFVLEKKNNNWSFNSKILQPLMPNPNELNN